MLLIFTALAAFPIGLLVRNRMAGHLAYGVLAVHLFVFQTASLVMEWVEGSTAAFGDVDDPGRTGLGDTWAYYVVNLVILGVGFGLVALGQRLASRRSARRDIVEVMTAR